MRKRVGQRRPGPVLELLEARPLLSGLLQTPTTSGPPAAVSLIVDSSRIAATASTAQDLNSQISDIRNDELFLASESASPAEHDDSRGAILSDFQEDVRELESYEHRQSSTANTRRDPLNVGVQANGLPEDESSKGHGARGGPAGREPVIAATLPANSIPSRTGRPPVDTSLRTQPESGDPTLLSELPNELGQELKSNTNNDHSTISDQHSFADEGTPLPLRAAGLIASVSPFHWSSMRRMLARQFESVDGGGIEWLEGVAPRVAIRVLLSAAFLDAALRWRRRSAGDRGTPEVSGMSIPGIPGLPRT